MFEKETPDKIPNVPWIMRDPFFLKALFLPRARKHHPEPPASKKHRTTFPQNIRPTGQPKQHLPCQRLGDLSASLWRQLSFAGHPIKIGQHQKVEENDRQRRRKKDMAKKLFCVNRYRY